MHVNYLPDGVKFIIKGTLNLFPKLLNPSDKEILKFVVIYTKDQINVKYILPYVRKLEKANIDVIYLCHDKSIVHSRTPFLLQPVCL